MNAPSNSYRAPNELRSTKGSRGFFSELITFIRLDAMSIKQFYSTKNLLLLAAMMVFLALVTGSGLSAISTGVLIAITYSNYPFTVSEKNNLDELYVTLSIDRKTVVLARYLFLAVNCFCLCAASLLIGALTLFIAGIFNISPFLPDSTAYVFVLTLFVMNSICLPMMFKMGYTKGRQAILLLLATVSVCVFILTILLFIAPEPIIPIATLETISQVAIPASAVFIIASWYISYRVSLQFYRKRKFE